MAAAGLEPDPDQIEAQEREMRENVQSHPLVGQLSQIAELRAQYVGNAGFLPKIDFLEARFQAFRRTRPDGNCFYRAYLFGIFEQLIGNAGRHAAFMTRAKGSLDYTLAIGYERVAVDLFHEEFVSCIETLAVEGANETTLLGLLEENDGYLVCWMRILTSAYLKTNKELYGAFLTSHPTIEAFCAAEVDPLEKDADHLQITALSSYLGVPVNVMYLDQSPGEAAAEHKFFEAEAGCAYVPVTLLYRPGHYDLIYPM